MASSSVLQMVSLGGMGCRALATQISPAVYSLWGQSWAWLASVQCWVRLCELNFLTLHHRCRCMVGQRGSVDHEGPSQDLGIGVDSKPGIVFTTYLDLVTLTMRKLIKTLT